MALYVGTDVTEQARALLTDTAGEVYTDAKLFPFLKRAYRYAQRYLRTKEVSLLIKQSSSIALTVGSTTFTRPSGSLPNYPADMLRPLQLREKQTGGAGRFTLMNMANGFLPDQDAQDALGLWVWRNDLITTLGAKQNKDVQILYEADLTALTSVNDTLYIPDSLDPLAAITASFAAATRDEQVNSEKLRQIGERDLDLIAQSEKLLLRAKGATWQTN